MCFIGVFFTNVRAVICYFKGLDLDVPTTLDAAKEYKGNRMGKYFLMVAS